MNQFVWRMTLTNQSIAKYPMPSWTNADRRQLDIWNRYCPTMRVIRIHFSWGIHRVGFRCIDSEEEISTDREDIYENVNESLPNFARQTTDHPSLALPNLNRPPEFHHPPILTEIDQLERTTVIQRSWILLDPHSLSPLKDLVPEQLPEYEETAIRNESPYIDSTLHITSHQPFNAPESVSQLILNCRSFALLVTRHTYVSLNESLPFGFLLVDR